MTNPIAQGLSHRGRRCALIPHGVTLTPEEELLIMNRIRYHPIPPPDGATLRRTVARMNDGRRKADARNTKHKHSGLNSTPDAWTVVDSGESLVEIEFKKQITWEGNEPSTKLPSHKRQRNIPHTHTTILGAGRNHTESETRSTPQTSRPRRASWSVDIPHMSEIPPLNSRPSMAAMGSSEHGGYDLGKSATSKRA